MKKIIIQLFVGIIVGLIFISCDKKTEVEPVEENELITTINLTFTEGANSKTFSYQDLTGNGKPTKNDEIVLDANKTYTFKIELLDESKTPVKNVTLEVAKEQEEHLFIYTTTPAALATFSYTDIDANKFPVGLKGSYQTKNAGTGTLKVKLRHQPLVSGKPSKDGTATPGSDDVNIDFKLKVQ